VFQDLRSMAARNLVAAGVHQGDDVVGHSQAGDNRGTREAGETLGILSK
jgi:hypothetical protein